MGLGGLIKGTTKLSYNVTSYAALLSSIVLCVQFFGLCAKNAANKDQRVLDLVYWRDPRKSGIVLGVLLTILFALRMWSFITVLSWLGLLALLGAFGLRVYKMTTKKDHPLEQYLDHEVTLPTSKIHEHVDEAVRHLQEQTNNMRKVLLAEDLAHTIKVGLLLWAMTYIGHWFSGLTLATLAVISAFAVPKVYETHKDQIDEHYNTVHAKGTEIYKQVEEKVPFLKKKQT